MIDGGQDPLPNVPKQKMHFLNIIMQMGHDQRDKVMLCKKNWEELILSQSEISTLQ
jgi:hypothetical protein